MYSQFKILSALIVTVDMHTVPVVIASHLGEDHKRNYNKAATKQHNAHIQRLHFSVRTINHGYQRQIRRPRLLTDIEEKII
jgi:hypothetical protein